MHPGPISFLARVAAAGITGFVAEDWVAVFRIRVGRGINSATLIAGGYRARSDGLTAIVIIDRPAAPETLFMMPDPAGHHCLQSVTAPAGLHEFVARLMLTAKGTSLDLPFRMT